MSRGFRIAGAINEFLKDLEVLKGSDHKLIVWQNDANGDKQIFDGHYDSYIKEKDKISNHACTGAYGFKSIHELKKYTSKIREW